MRFLWRARKSELTRLTYLKELVKLLDEKGWSHAESYKLMKFLETMLKIRTPELKQGYIEFLRTKEEKEREGKKTMLMIEEMGMKQGMKQGIKQGIKQGRKEGLQKGKLETARNMLAEGLSPEIIKKVTGLTLERVNTL